MFMGEALLQTEYTNGIVYLTVMTNFGFIAVKEFTLDEWFDWLDYQDKIVKRTEISSAWKSWDKEKTNG